MEYADKGDLYQKICEFKKASVYFEESDIWRIFIQILKGLKALHEMKILHRDLKSANVFLFNDGTAKLGDLNVSKVARRGLGYTQTGTPYYARYFHLLVYYKLYDFIHILNMIPKKLIIKYEFLTKTDF